MLVKIKRSHKWIDTWKFSPAAIKFAEEGSYCSEPEGTMEYDDFWNQEYERCILGYEVPGVAGGTSKRVTGDHYFFLNYSPILLIDNNTKTVSARQQTGFPKFIDIQYDLYKEIELAELHGLDFPCLKARGKGLSYISAELGAHNFHLVPESNTIYIASDTGYLQDAIKGVLPKVQKIINHVNENCPPWRQLYDGSFTGNKMQIVAKHQVNRDGFWRSEGDFSAIEGISVANNPDKARGARASRVLWEESGNNPFMENAIAVNEAASKMGKFKVGLNLFYGTGGSAEADFRPFKKIYTNPRSYNAIELEDSSKTNAGKPKGYFFPVYYGEPGFIDKHGNSLVEECYDFYSKEREKKQGDQLARYMAERPFIDSEAMLELSNTNFPLLELKERKKEIVDSVPEPLVGEVYRMGEGKVKFKVNKTLVPYTHYSDDEILLKTKPNGAVVIYEEPQAEEGIIPDNRYIIAHDPVAQNEGTSVPCSYIIKRATMSSPTYSNNIVASWIGRPSMNDYYKTLFNLADMYNAKVCFENNVGHTAQYADKHKMMNRLAPDPYLPTAQAVSRGKYGVRIGHNKDELLRAFGEMLITPQISQNGEEKMMISSIEDIGLIEECLEYKEKDPSFNRVSSMLVAVIYLQKMHRKQEIDRRAKMQKSAWMRKLSNNEYFN